MIVLDSSFLVAYHNRTDVHHPRAVPAMEDLLAGDRGRLLLPEYVFLETVTVLMARRDLRKALEVGDLLLEAREVDFVPCSEIFLDVLGTFRTQGDATLSFTDAAILTIARAHDAAIATFDRGFVGIEGIRVVPEPGGQPAP